MTEGGVSVIVAATIVAVAVFVGSSMLVAVTVKVPVVAGAVNRIELAGEPAGAVVRVPPVVVKFTP